MGNDDNINVLDSTIEQLYKKAKLPCEITVILDYAKQLNSIKTSDRAPWVYKFLEMDYSLGPAGYGLRFNLETNPKTYAFSQLLKYDSIYRPMKYVYMPFGMTSCPACFSRDIAQNACAHVEKCLKNLFEVNGWKINPKATLGTMIHEIKKKYPVALNKDTLELIDSLNSLIYGKTKHEFEVELPRQQLLSLSESLAVYFVCRVLGLKLLQKAGTLTDVISEVDPIVRTARGLN